MRYKYSLVLGRHGPDSEKEADSWEEIEEEARRSDEFYRARGLNIRVTAIYYTVDGGPVQERSL